MSESNVDKEKREKMFVLDTNVILHDPRCINSFEENDITILSVVLEELDTFKKGDNEKSYAVRQFINELDILEQKGVNNENEDAMSEIFTKGISLGEGKGILRFKTPRIEDDDKVVTKKKNYTKDELIVMISDLRKEFIAKNFKKMYQKETNDNEILDMVHELKKEFPKKSIILVTKDKILRMKAGTTGIKAQDYRKDKVITDINKLYPGKSVINECPIQILDAMYAEEKEISTEKFQDIFEKKLSNEYFILQSNKTSALGKINAEKTTITRVEKMTIANITPKNSEQTFAADALLNDLIKLVTLSGPAGTGKTLFAILVGLYKVMIQKQYERLIIASPLVPLSMKEIGFLPGDAKEKVSQYMQGLFDNLNFIKSQCNAGTATETNTGKKQKKTKSYGSGTITSADITKLQEEGRIEIQPLASIRGRSINNACFIIDEAQNLTPHEVKTIITRAGANTKIVLCGDVTQIDVTNLDATSNGLAYVIERMKGESIYAQIMLEKGERSYLAELASKKL